ncbi:MAG TPA: hypothetical protein VHI77_11560 [Solirubrobacterales bacterium]|jgi:hypothetical protein|nr:hypothetical protein [Solirubrobacterales bacterium]
MISAWKLPLIVGAIAIVIVGGFALGGAGTGLAMGGLCAGSIVFLAARKPPRAPIVPPLAGDPRRYVLLILAVALEEPGMVEAAVRATAADDADLLEPEVLLLAPSPTTLLERWTSDVGPGRERAQRDLVVSVGALAAAGIAARGQVGDDDLVQAVEDQLRSFPATEVVLAEGDGSVEESQASDLAARLAVPLRRLRQAGPRSPSQLRRRSHPGRSDRAGFARSESGPRRS